MNTPQTDALKKKYNKFGDYPWAQLCEKLEKELMQATTELKSWREDCCCKMKKERDVLRDALENAKAHIFHTAGCTCEQRRETGCICGATNALNMSNKALGKETNDPSSR